MNAGELIGHLFRRKRGGMEPAGRNIDPGDAGRHRFCFVAGRLRDCSQEVAGLRIEQRIIGERAGRDDPRHFALHEPLRLLRVFDLFADRGPMPGGDDLGQVRIELMVRKAGHRHRVVALVAAREGDARASGRRSWHRRRTARRSRPCETAATRRRPPAWRRDTAASWAKAKRGHGSRLRCGRVHASKVEGKSRGLGSRKP